MPDSNAAHSMNITNDKATSKSKLPGRVVPYATLARSAGFNSIAATKHRTSQESQQRLGIMKTTVLPHSRTDLQIPERRKKLENLKMQRTCSRMSILGELIRTGRSKSKRGGRPSEKVHIRALGGRLPQGGAITNSSPYSFSKR
jgi:hypothetical protein